MWIEGPVTWAFPGYTLISEKKMERYLKMERIYASNERILFFFSFLLILKIVANEWAKFLIGVTVDGVNWRTIL